MPLQPHPCETCVITSLIKVNQRKTTSDACCLMQFSGVQGNATIKIKSKIMASRTNVMQMISLDLRVLFTSSSKHMYEELSEKTPQDNISWHQE